jgi:hypothetical protein
MLDANDPKYPAYRLADVIRNRYEAAKQDMRLDTMAQTEEEYHTLLTWQIFALLMTEIDLGHLKVLAPPDED